MICRMVDTAVIAHECQMFSCILLSSSASCPEFPSLCRLLPKLAKCKSDDPDMPSLC